MMWLDKRDYQDALAVGIKIGDTIPTEFCRATKKAEVLCKKISKQMLGILSRPRSCYAQYRNRKAH